MMKMYSCIVILIIGLESEIVCLPLLAYTSVSIFKSQEHLKKHLHDMTFVRKIYRHRILKLEHWLLIQSFFILCHHPPLYEHQVSFQHDYFSHLLHRIHLFHPTFCLEQCTVVCHRLNGVCFTASQLVFVVSIKTSLLIITLPNAEINSNCILQ